MLPGCGSDGVRHTLVLTRAPGSSGSVLVRGLEKESDALEVGVWFEKKTSYRLGVCRWEGLPEDVKRAFTHGKGESGSADASES